MNESDLKELNQLAMLAELARPLAHECNNFLNNLLLQLAISEKSFPDNSRAEWANIRREGRKLASLYQQWQRQRNPSSEGPTKIDVFPLIQKAVDEVRSEGAAIELHAEPAGNSIWIMGFAGEVQRLVSLLLRYSVAAMQSSGIDSPALEIRLEKKQERMLLRMCHAAIPAAKLPWADFDDVAASDRIALSLPALACKSLVDRYEGKIRIERPANGCAILTIDFPLAPP